MAKRKDKTNMTEEERRHAKEHALATKRFYTLIVLLFLILAMIVASIVLWVITPRPEDADKPPSTEGNMFAVKTITLEGNTKYLEESVIGESGVLIGQSVFAVKSNEIERELLDTFPYYSDVQVQVLHMDEVKISVTETQVIGVMYTDGCWVPIGTNGKALDKQPITSDRPKNMLYIKGKSPEGGLAVGSPALEDYTASVLSELLSAINQYDLTDVTEIDLTDLTDIRLVWRNQIEVLLGNTTNLLHEIGVTSATIPKLLQSRGEQITGCLNLTSYSNAALENQAVFTPSSLLPTSTTATRKPATGETTQPTTQPTQAEDGEDYDDSYDDYDDSYDDYDDSYDDYDDSYDDYDDSYDDYDDSYDEYGAE